MFKCQKCGRTTEPREPQRKEVVETRNVTYRDGHTGTEIVREIAICKDCVGK